MRCRTGRWTALVFVLLMGGFAAAFAAPPLSGARPPATPPAVKSPPVNLGRQNAGSVDTFQKPKPGTTVDEPRQPQPTIESPESAAVHTPEGPVDVTVYVLAYGTRGGKSVGSCSPVRITVGGRGEGPVRIGFFESEVGGSGAQWRAAGWTAAITAAQLTNFNHRATQVAFDIEGRIDGPSAGGLMTIGVLAGVLGHPVREDAAMTGTINPDGTIGPVGGIPHKIDGAAAAGKKLVLIPAGIRFDHDSNLDQEVDLIERGREQGVEVHPVVDIHRAYELMTGHKLPRHPLADQPLVSKHIRDMTMSKTSEWLTRFGQATTKYTNLPSYAHSKEANDMFEETRADLDRIKSLLAEGEISAAYWDVAMANAKAYIAMELGRNSYTLQSRGLQAMLERVQDNGWLQEDIDEMAERLRDETPETLDQLEMYILACDAFLEAVGCQAIAAQALDNLPDDATKAAEETLMASFKQIIGWIDLQLCDDYLDISRKLKGGPPIPENAPITELGHFYQRAAEANLTTFETLFLQDVADAIGTSVADARNRLMLRDLEYGVMRAAQLSVMQQLPKYFGEGEALEYAYLASGLYLYPRGAMLIAKYYSLGADVDESMVITKVARERTLSDWLDYAEDETRRSIGSLSRSGMDISVCAQMYEIARIQRHRDLQGRIQALTHYQSAHVHAEALRYLGGLQGPSE